MTETWQPVEDGMKVCTKCKRTMTLSCFYKIHTGARAGKYHAQCRQCQSARDANYRRKNLEASRETDRIYYENNKVAHQNATRDWSIRNPEKRREYTRRTRHKYQERSVARNAVNWEVRKGNFPPANTMVCEHCQEAQAAHWHHHKGYSQEYRLDVIALCTECHGNEHTHRIARKT